MPHASPMDDGDEKPPKKVRATSPADGGGAGDSAGASCEGGGSGGGDACTEGKEGGKEPGPTKKLRTGSPPPTITIRIKDQVRLALRPAELSRN